MAHQNIGVHQFEVGDQVRVIGYDEAWDGNSFIVQEIKQHPEDQYGLLLKMSEEEATRLWNKMGEARWWIADGDNVKDVWWWEGFLINETPPTLENE